MKKCFSCGRYTFKPACPACGTKTRDPKPVRFSPEDRYGKYRRMAKAARKD
ncbi:MAG: RNA-protein complex protein Nop10 [Candidatus Aenigmatarchaeota archaeon]|nr:MAG: RNA-protein complex protein Nop10 [Candidatus Aenigmarchaeota archaeon]